MAGATGWEPAAVLAGIAAATGVAALVMSGINQRGQHQWQERQEGERRTWEAAQEASRREWQHRQTVGLRWDELKRDLYAEFLAIADRLEKIDEEMGNNRGHLAEDLVNRMETIRAIVTESHPEMIEGLDEDELDAFWNKRYETEKASMLADQRTLFREQQELKTRFRRIESDITVLAQSSVVEAVVDLAQEIRYGAGAFGRSMERDRAFSTARAALLIAIRADLQVPDEVSSAEQAS